MTRRVLLNIVFAVVGVGLLAWQIGDLVKPEPWNFGGGLSRVGDGLGRIGVGLLGILALAAMRFGLRSYAWMALCDQAAPLSGAIAATISGDALGNLTPLGLVASEPAKAVYLGRHVDAKSAFAALTAENFFYIISVAVYVIIGAVALLWWYDGLPSLVRYAGIASGVLMAIVLLAAGWIAWQRPAAASGFLNLIPSTRVRTLVDRVRDFEIRTYGSAGRAGARLGIVALAETGFHVFSFAESWLTLYLLTGSSQPLAALILDSVNRAINAVFKPLIPFRVGVDEVSAEQVAVAIDLATGVGLQAALVRRIRMIVWGVVGLIVWAKRPRASGATGTTGTTGPR